MKLGIIVNNETHLKEITALTLAATKQKHKVVIFAMDKGTSLLPSDEFKNLAKTTDVSLSYCKHSATKFGIKTEELPENIICGSQLNNAMMMHEADRIVVL